MPHLLKITGEASLCEKDLIPEGIAYDPVTQTLYVGSTYRRKIVRVEKNGATKDFVGEKQDGLWGVLGMKVDAKRRVLWAVSLSASLLPIIDFKETDNWRAGIFKYDLNTGKLIKKYLLLNDGSPST